jgi:hypothetical protein
VGAYWLEDCLEIDCQGADLSGNFIVNPDDFTFLAQHWLEVWEYMGD